jgi:hypothetical protein
LCTSRSKRVLIFSVVVMPNDTDELRAALRNEERFTPPSAARQPLISEPDLTLFLEEPAEYDALNQLGDNEQISFPDDNVGRMKVERQRRRPLAVAAILGIAVIGGVAVVLMRAGGASGPPPAIITDTSAMKPLPESTGIRNAESHPPKLNNDRVDPGELLPNSRLEVASGGPIAGIPPLVAVTAPRPAAIPSKVVVAAVAPSGGWTDIEPTSSPQQLATGTDGAVLVQVSSLRSEEVALATFRELQRLYPSILGDQRPDIQRADLGERGVYYRVRVGYPTRDQAVSMCEDLKAAGGDCLLAAR